MMSSNDCTPEQDEIVRDFCRENDVGQMKACPKCAMGGKPGEHLLTPFCQHKYCPIREWRDEKMRPEREAKEAARREQIERAEYERLKGKFET